MAVKYKAKRPIRGLESSEGPEDTPFTKTIRNVLVRGHIADKFSGSGSHMVEKMVSKSGLLIFTGDGSPKVFSLGDSTYPWRLDHHYCHD